MIIGLAGLKNSGKDTVAAYLVKQHRFERKAFADPLKRSVAALFDIPFTMVDQLKNDSNAEVVLRVHHKDVHGAFSSHHDMTFRTFLQRYGTEAHRDVFDQDFWLDYTLPVRGYYPGRAICVTDVRFPNEANRVRELGGELWMILRQSMELIPDTHASEQFGFDCDKYIDNNGTIEDLYARVEEALGATIITSDS